MRCTQSAARSAASRMPPVAAPISCRASKMRAWSSRCCASLAASRAGATWAAKSVRSCSSSAGKARVWYVQTPRAPTGWSPAISGTASAETMPRDRETGTAWSQCW